MSPWSSINPAYVPRREKTPGGRKVRSWQVPGRTAYWYPLARRRWVKNNELKVVIVGRLGNILLIRHEDEDYRVDPRCVFPAQPHAPYQSRVKS